MSFPPPSQRGNNTQFKRFVDDPLWVSCKKKIYFKKIRNLLPKTFFVGGEIKTTKRKLLPVTERR
jgi:hypothetical protein